MDIIATIHANVNVTQNGCWVWLGARNGDGYGQLTINGRTDKTHRLMFAAANGPIPDGMKVCHACDNPPCCNPDHLFLGTDADNRRDAQRKGRLPRGSAMHTAVLTEADIQPIVERLMAGESHRSIARSLNVKPSVIHDIHAGRTWMHLVDASMFPKRRTRSKLTAAAIDEIRALHRSGMSPKTLATRYGVSKTAIHRVSKR